MYLEAMPFRLARLALPAIVGGRLILIVLFSRQLVRASLDIVTMTIRLNRTAA